MFLKLLAVIFLFALSHSQGMAVLNQVIRQNTTYNISLPFTGTLNAGASVTVLLPTGSYPASSLVGVTCTPACTGAGTNTMSFSPLTVVSGYIYIVIQNIVNPPSTQGVYFNCTINNIPSAPTDLGFTYADFRPGTLSSCTILFNPNTVSTLGTMVFSITPANAVLAGGSVLIKFPSSWQYSAGAQSIISSLSCANITNINTPSCNPSGLNVLLSNGFSTSVSSSFSFSISTVNSIPVSYQSTQISVQTQLNTNALIDTGSCTITSPSPKTITLTSTTPTPSVGQSFTFSVIATISNKIAPNDVLSIIFPSTLTINPSTITLVANGSAANCQSIYFNTMTITPLAVVGQTYSYNLTDSRFSSTNVCTEIQLIISGFNLSIPSTLPRTIEYIFTRSSYKYADGTISITPTVNTLNSLTVSLTSNTTVINANVLFTLSFITVAGLNTNSKIRVTFPSSVQVQGATACSNGLSGGSPFTPSSCTFASNVLQVSGVPATLAGVNVRISFSGFLNPSSIGPVSFGISTIYGDTGNVDQLASILYTPTPDLITQFDVSSSSYVNGQAATYTVTYVNKNVLPVNSAVMVGLPIGITWNSSMPTCVLLIGGVTQGSASCVKTTSVGSVYNNGINFTLNNNVALTPGTNLSFAFGLINNAITTQPSNPFSIYSSGLGNLIEITELNTAFRITTTTPSTFTSVAITSGSPVNGATTTYTLSFTPSTRQPSTSVLSITIPTNITVLGNYSCYNGSTQLSCNYIAPTLSITLASELQAGSTYSYTLRNIVNPRTMSPTASFSVATKDSTYDVSASTATGITNTQPNNINSLSMTLVSPSQSYMNSTQNLQFTLTTTNYLTSTDYITLVFPPGYKYLGTAGAMVTCSPLSCTPDISNISILRVTSTFTPSIYTFSFAISNYLSPNSTTNPNFAVNTYQADGTQIDAINTGSSSALVTFSISCTLPCRTCSTLNLTQCLTCYSADIHPYPYFFNQNCYATCPNITYLSGTDCLPCVSPCRTCTTLSACTSCIASYFLFAGNSSCAVTCPANYYGSLPSYECALCTSPCFNCSLSSTFCTSCQPFYLLQDNQCLLSCSNSYFNQSGICYPCDVSCARCVGLSTNCTTCATGYSRSGTQCVSSCPVTQVSINGVCVNCSSSCYECAGTTTNCTSCVDGKVLYNGGCVTSCPGNTILVNGICQQNDTTKSLSDNKIIPFPYLISCAIICVICFLSKFSSPLTSIPAMGVSLNSMVEILSTVTILILAGTETASLFSSTSLKMIGVILVLVGVVIDLAFNISTIVYFCKKIDIDVGYMRWKKRPSNTTVSRLCLVLSGLYYKFIYFQFCKAFGSSHLHGTIQNPVKFYPITIMTLVGVVNSIFIITGCSLIALDSTTVVLSAMYIQAIDCLLVKIVGGIMALASLKKSEDFFDDPIKSNNLQDLNQETLEGLNENMNDSFMMEHSVSYVGGKPYLDDQSPKKKKGLLYNARNNAINQEDEDDGADLGLNKKDTGMMDDQDYFKTNDKNILGSGDLNEYGLNTSKFGGKVGRYNNDDKLLDESGNQMNPDGEDPNLYFEGDVDSPNQGGRNKNGGVSKNNQDGNRGDDQKSKSRSPGKDEKSPGKGSRSPGKDKSPGKSQKSGASPGPNKNKHQKLNDNSEDEINELDENIDKQFLSEEDEGLGTQMKHGGNPLNKDILRNDDLEDNPSKTLGQEINLSSIQKKRSSRNKEKELGDRSPDGKSPMKEKLKDQKQKPSNSNTPINHLKNKSQLEESRQNQGVSPKVGINSKSPHHIDRLEEIESKELNEKQDSLIYFQKDSNQREEEPDSVQPLRKGNSREKGINQNKQQEKNSLENAVAEEELNNNSGLIDSSAYGTEMIEGLVRGMTDQNNPNNRKNNNDQQSELESAHEGDIQFPEVSPSQFNIQNQRYYDFAETDYNPQGQSNRQFDMESFRRGNHTQHLYPGSQSQSSIINNPGFYQNRTGALLPEQRHNIPAGITKAYQSFDQPLASIHEKGKSIRVSQSKYMNQSLSKNSRYQTVTPDDINKRQKLKSLEKIYLQPLDTKSTQPLHKRSPKYNL